MTKRILIFLAVLASLALTPADIQTLRYPGLLTNAGFENAKARWTNAGTGAFTIDTSSNLGFGNNSGAWDAAANLDTLTSEQVTVPKGWYGQACTVEVQYKGGDANIAVRIIDGSLASLGSTTLATATNFTERSLAFTCPTSGTIAFQLIATANAAIVYVDQIHIGLNPSINIGSDGVARTTQVNVRAGSAQRSELNLYQNGSAKTTIGVAIGNNDLTPGSTVGDTVIRSQSSGDLLVTGDGGSTTVIKATTGGVLEFPHLAAIGILGTTASGEVTKTNIWTAAAEVASGGDCVPISTCTIVTNYGGAISSVSAPSSAGNYVVNFTASFWSSAPACVANSVRGGDTHCNINGAVSTSAATVACLTSSTGAGTNGRFSITCTGPRT